MPKNTKQGTRQSIRKPRGPQLSQNELAYTRLKERVTTLVYKPGDSLNIPQLMQDLEQGRTPINHALHRLATEGLIHIIPRKGVMVAPLSIDNALEIIEVRLVNEGLCARLAASRITAAELKQLNTTLEKLETAIRHRDLEAVINIDCLFHEQIAMASKNLVLIDILKVLHARSQRFWASSLASEAHLEEVSAEHRAIIEALTAGNAQAAHAAVEEHILSFKRSLLQIR